ncbi:Branched-chain alpha-ketoacid dehydrogenase kinase/Pyruvate dehydrogenase kinase, N-terminal [Phytophthora cactorum]|nr:Branched-chain alpha-ketoacid dehydrogenase kinase/Pyruvate dehydrogenase kinase, N-terminal [Phytophthora cactorum]
MPTSGAAKVLAEVYRLHHIPLPPITLQALLKRGPHASPAIAASLQNDPQALSKWRENLPDELPQAEPIVSLREQLLDSFDRLMSCPLPANLTSERDFVELHSKIRKQHATMHGNIAEAVQALEYEPQGLSESLDNFYNSRIGIRMLVDQHIAAQTPKPGSRASSMTRRRPLRSHGTLCKRCVRCGRRVNGEQLPEIIVSGDEDATYRYVPQHIEIILTEVFKNAVLNSVAAAKRTGTSSPPPVNVLISVDRTAVGPGRWHDPQGSQRAVQLLPHGHVPVLERIRSRCGSVGETCQRTRLLGLVRIAYRPAVRQVLWRRAGHHAYGGTRRGHVYLHELPHQRLRAQGQTVSFGVQNFHGGTGMQSLPFRLLVVNELDLKDAVRSDQHNWQPPGVVEESACQPLWKSKP